MADTKISNLTAATTPLAGTEVLPIVQSGVTKQVSVANLTAGRAVSALTVTSTVTTGTAPFTVTSTTEVANLTAANATTASNLKSNATTGVMQIVGPAAAATRIMTIPDANFTAARTDAAQTFTGNQTFNNSVGIGGAPSSWSLFNPLELAGNGAVMGVSGLNLFNNAYYNGSDYIYKTTAAATRLLNSGGEWYWYRAASGTAGTAIVFGTPKMTLDASDNLSVPGIYTNTTASAANVYVDSAGKLYRSTSARKYKQDIRDLEEIDTNLLRPVRYKSKCDGDDQSKDHFGIVADEAAEKGLEELVLRGANNEIEGFQYERLSVVLLKKLQTLEVKINSILTR